MDLLTTFETIVNKGEIAHHEQFLYMRHCFQLYSIIILSFMEISHTLTMSSAGDLLYVGKG